MFEATQSWDSANKLRLWTSATSRRRSRQDDSSNRTSLARFSKSWSFQVHKDESVIHNSNNIQWCKNVNESMWGSEIDFEYKSLQRVAATYKDTACIDTKTPKMCLHLFLENSWPNDLSFYLNHPWFVDSVLSLHFSVAQESQARTMLYIRFVPILPSEVSEVWYIMIYIMWINIVQPQSIQQLILMPCCLAFHPIVKL